MSFNTVRYIWNHPVGSKRRLSSLWSFIQWQIESRTFRHQKVFSWVNGTRLSVSQGETGITGNLYCGLQEFGEMGFLLHAMLPGELFVDVGANAGSYTVLASGVCGCRSISFEPLPEAFGRMRNNIEINGLQKLVSLRNEGVADKPGKLKFTEDFDTGNHVVLSDNPEVSVAVVPVVSLDTVLNGENPVVLKIDVEGFEKPVLEGAIEVLQKGSLLAVIMETNDEGLAFGHSKEDLHLLMGSYGFAPYFYHPFERSFKWIASAKESDLNCIFIRDLGVLEQRVSAAAIREVLGVSF